MIPRNNIIPIKLTAACRRLLPLSIHPHGSQDLHRDSHHHQLSQKVDSTLPSPIMELATPPHSRQASGPVTANACAHPLDPNNSPHPTPHRRILTPVSPAGDLTSQNILPAHHSTFIRAKPHCREKTAGAPRRLGCLPAHRIVSRAYTRDQRTVDGRVC